MHKRQLRERYEASGAQTHCLGSVVGPAHYAPEPQRIPIEFGSLDIEYRASEARDAIASVGTFERSARSGGTTPNSPSAIYENLSFHTSLQQELSKSLILSRFFRSTERNFAAYENLCTGCGYGVFEARGRLCHFCQFVVHGAYERQAAAAHGEEEDASVNIYENVCDKCAAIYSSDECDCCPPTEGRAPGPPTPPTPAAPTREAKPKKGLFHGLIGSLRRAKSSATPPRSPQATSPRQRKRLEIVHNVEGFDSVFRTQDTFDLDRICELKRSQTSRSEQHIYGRLKHPKDSGTSTLPASLSATPPLSQSQSHDILLTTSPGPGPTTNGREEPAKPTSKRPRISRTRLLRTGSRKNPSTRTTPEPTAPAKQSLYLAEQVCQWMTSLRRETHSYWSFGLADDGALCDPKSIPARSTLIGGPQRNVTNGESNGRAGPTGHLRDVSGDGLSLSSNSNDLDLGERRGAVVVTLRRPRTGESETESEAATRAPAEDELEDEERLVRDFKRSLLAKEMHQQRQQRRVAVEPTTSTSTTTTQQRAKRQAIYLKIDESPGDVSSQQHEHQRIGSDDDRGDESEPSYNNYDEHQHQHEHQHQNKHRALGTAASEQIGERGLASHRVALQPITASQSKRCGIYERDSEFVNDILSAFETFLRRGESDTLDEADVAPPEVGTSCEPSSAAAASPDEASRPPTNAPHPIDRENPDRVISVCFGEHDPNSDSGKQRASLGRTFDVERLLADLLLSRCLNRVVVCYEAPLVAFLRGVRERRSFWRRPTDDHWVRRYHRFVSFCQRRNATSTSEAAPQICGNSEPVRESAPSETPRGGGGGGEQASGPVAVTISEVQETVSEAGEGDDEDERRREEPSVARDDPQSPRATAIEPTASLGDSPRQPKPQVPQRDPKTCISSARVATPSESSPPLPAKRESPPVATARIMTVPTVIPQDRSSITSNNNNNNSNTLNNNEEEEDIYQPIWKFQTVGEVQERYHTDADYYELDATAAAAAKSMRVHDSTAAPTISIATDVEDHGEWETDDEFMFATQLECGGLDGEGRGTNEDGCSLNSSTVRSSRSGSSFTGSTVTGYASSTMTMASVASASLAHPLLRSIGVFYSPTEPKLRAVVYDYDRVQASTYFAKRQPVVDNGGVGVGASVGKVQSERSPVPPPRTTSASKTKAAPFPGGESQLQLLPDSVQAWKFLLLDVNYLEDEEDMIVSESEILRAQEPKEDPETRQTQQLNFLQRFKSASIGNLIDIPTEEDKKSIAERMRSKLQRGVLKLNVRSPKSEKKNRGKFRRAEATSLYLEDGMKPKYPIFGAALDQLELNQTTQPNVPRFVVDCVEYIERKECVQQDGLYRASGNKISIDELKQKLSESYIYDPKLLVTDDIHTLTSLLKQFFRELGAPLIPQETYERLGRNLTEAAAIERLRAAFDEMREPNRSTLKFLIRHLTTVASFSAENRMPASNLAIVWGPCILSANQIEYDIARMNTLAKVLIENYDRIFGDNERLVS